MDCSIVREYISSYIDQELDDNTALKIDYHLKNCEHCSTEFEIQQKISSLLYKKLARIKAPEYLRLKKHQHKESFF